MAALERGDERAARMLACGADHAKRLRLTIIPDSIAVILTAFRDQPTQREEFRRRCLVAASEEPEVSLSPDLLVAAQAADAEEDVREVRFLTDNSPESLRALIAASRREIGLQQDRLRALEDELTRRTR